MCSFYFHKLRLSPLFWETTPIICHIITVYIAFMKPSFWKGAFACKSFGFCFIFLLVCEFYYWVVFNLFLSCYKPWILLLISGLWVQIPLRPTFYSYFSESFSDEYHMYQFILLQICDYLCKISLEANVATDEGNGRNEMWTLNKEIKVE